MVLSDLSIRRPVFATVMSLLLVVLGVIAYTRLTLRELPAIDPPIVSVSVEYPGASAAVVETRITQVLEDSLSGIEGVETIESQSSNGEGSISIEFSLDRDIEARGERRARRGQPRRGPHAAGGRPARDREGGVRFRRDPVAQHELDADGHARS